MGRHAARNNCPFCGHYASEVRPRGSMRLAHQGDCYVRCCSCGAQGPVGSDARDASRQWNHRAEFFDRHGAAAPVVPIDIESLR